jgi:phosphatidylinositol alpha-1,6-mannosyltransferase
VSSDGRGARSGLRRLAVVTNDFPPKVGGIQTYILSLLESLDEDEVTVVAPDVAGAAATDSQFGFEVVRLKTTAGALVPTPGTARQIASLVSSRGVGVVGLTSMTPLGPLGGTVARLADIPLIVWHHGAELAIPAKIPGGALLLRRLADRVSIHFVVSRWTERIARKVFGPGADIRLMRFGIDSGRFNPAPDSGADKRHSRERLGIVAQDADPLVLSVGRLVKRKGNDVLISAMVSVKARYPSSSLVIVGSGTDKARLENLANEIGTTGAVEFLGEVEADRLSDLYRCADVFASPIRSRFLGLEGEGLGITLVEAAACGLPVVAGRSGGTPEAVVDGVTGFVVDGSDSYEVAEAIGKLAGDRELRISMGRRGREFVESEFNRARMVDTYRQAIDDIFEGRR